MHRPTISRFAAVRRFFGALAVGAGITFGATVRGQDSLASEGFNYPVGSGFNGIATTAPGFSGSVRFLYEIPAVSNIGSGSLSYTDANSMPLGATGNYYFQGHGALFEDFNTSGGGPFASYLDGSSNIGANGTTLYLGIAIQTTTPGSFSAFELMRDSDNDANRVASIDIWTGHSTGADGQYYATLWSPLNIDTQDAALGVTNQSTDFFVLRFDFGTGGTDTLSIYANPTLDGEPASPTAVLTGSDLSFDRIGIADFGAIRISVDEIRVGATYASAIPEPATEAMGIGLAAIAGALIFRRRRHSVAA